MAGQLKESTAAADHHIWLFDEGKGTKAAGLICSPSGVAGGCMSQFLPFEIIARGKRQIVSNLVGVKAAIRLVSRQPEGELANVLTLIDQAGSGHIAPRLAFQAFEDFAKRQGIYRPIEKSATLVAGLYTRNAP
jgi:hypothetical protein